MEHERGMLIFALATLFQSARIISRQNAGTPGETEVSSNFDLAERFLNEAEKRKLDLGLGDK